MQSFTLEEFKKIHQEWKESDLGIRDCCANSGIKESRFYYWKKRVESPKLAIFYRWLFISVNLKFQKDLLHLRQ